MLISIEEKGNRFRQNEKVHLLHSLMGYHLREMSRMLRSIRCFPKKVNNAISHSDSHEVEVLDEKVVWKVL